jgi:hypothetical protein
MVEELAATASQPGKAYIQGEQAKAILITHRKVADCVGLEEGW